MSLFHIVLGVCMAVIALCILGGLVLILRTRDVLTRGVMSDLIFYSMILIYLIWSFTENVSIAYDIMLLAAIIAGILPSLSTARIITRGRR